MTDYPKISIVTPSYNQGKYLEKTIVSVLEQGYPNLEYIIIDGGSTDESVEIIRKYQDRLAYWVSEPDRGQSHAINKGFERASGEIFGWLNSDDWYHPGALQAVAEAFVATPEAGAVVGAGEMVDEEGAQLICKSPTKIDLDFLYHWLEDFFWQPSTFFTKAIWQECGPLDENTHFAMDLDLWLKIASSSYFITVQNMLSCSLKHGRAKTSACSCQTIMDAVSVISRHGGSSSVLINAFKYATYLEEKEKGLVWQIDNLKEQLEWTDTKYRAEREWFISEHSRQLAERDQRIDDLLNSASWKITKPLRWLVSKFR